jgi:hypothetical protein
VQTLGEAAFVLKAQGQVNTKPRAKLPAKETIGHSAGLVSMLTAELLTRRIRRLPGERRSRHVSRAIWRELRKEMGKGTRRAIGQLIAEGLGRLLRIGLG